MRRIVLFAAVLTFLAWGVASAQDAPAAGDVDEKALGPGISLTVYNGNFAVVKERRPLKLAPGKSWVKFTDVAALIDPTSVTFSSLTDPAGTRVLEQNYEFDLVSADKLMQKYLDRKITLVTADGREIAGTLMSSDAETVVLKKDDGSIEMVPRAKNVRDILFEKLPSGLLTKPTLVWYISSDKGGDQLLKVAYMTQGMDWRADYTLEMMENDKAINWAGWVTVNNNSGTTYSKAWIKLMAGEVHRVVEARRGLAMGPAKSAGFGGGRLGEVEEKAFAEYHLYTITKPSTLADRQTKQLEFVDRSEVPVVKKYTYRPTSGNWWDPASNAHVDVEVQFKNSKENNMGMPLPKGVVRLYKRDWEGQVQMLGQAAIDHTPKDEVLKFQMGSAFDVLGERKMVAERRPTLRSLEQDVEITLRNHKTEKVTVEVEEFFYRYKDWTLLAESQKGTKKDYRTQLWPVEVSANGESKLTYSVRYTW